MRKNNVQTKIELFLFLMGKPVTMGTIQNCLKLSYKTADYALHNDSTESTSIQGLVPRGVVDTFSVSVGNKTGVIMSKVMYRAKNYFKMIKCTSCGDTHDVDFAKDVPDYEKLQKQYQELVSQISDDEKLASVFRKYSSQMPYEQKNVYDFLKKQTKKP